MYNTCGCAVHLECTGSLLAWCSICSASYPSPASHCSEHQLSRSERTEERCFKRNWKKEKRKKTRYSMRNAWAKQVQDFAMLPLHWHPHWILQHILYSLPSCPSLSPPSLLANKHALRTHGMHSKMLSQAPRANTHSHTGTQIRQEPSESRAAI